MHISQRMFQKTTKLAKYNEISLRRTFHDKVVFSGSSLLCARSFSANFSNAFFLLFVFPKCRSFWLTPVPVAPLLSSLLFFIELCEYILIEVAKSIRYY